MATRMQQRRGTATQWTTANPILAAAEIGFESDTGKFKIGDGTNHWADLSYFLDASAAGVQDAINAAISNLVDGAPDLLNTMNELAAAINDDPEFFANLSTTLDENVAFAVSLANQHSDELITTTIASNIGSAVSTHNSDTTNVHGIADTSLLATEAYVENAKSQATTYADGILSTHLADSTNVHGIADTSLLALKSEVSSAQSNAEQFATGAVGTHSLDTTNVHGIADTANLAYQSDITGAEDYADAAVSTHSSDTTNIHGIADTADLVIHSELDAHANDTTNVHGISDTSALATKAYADSAVSTHEADTTNVHGIADTSALATKTYVNSAVSTHEADTTSVHGITDTSKLVTTDGTQTLTNKTITSPSGLVKADVGLGNVDNTSDANKPISSATQTALDLKAPKAAPTFTGTLNAADVVISGNLTVSGTTTTVSANNLVVDDSLIYLADQNTSSDALDIGVYGAYYPGSGVGHKHTGLFRDASDSGKWKLISNGAEPTSNVIDLTSVNYDTLVLGALEATSATIGNVSNTELQYLDGVTSAIQTQIDAKAPKADPTFTGTVNAAAITASGLVTATASGVAFSDGTQTKQGVPSRTPINQQTASYTVVLTDRDSLVEVSNASATTVTIPTNATAAFPVGTSIDILQTSTGQVTIAGAAGVTVNGTPGLKLRTQWSSATLFKRATDTWVVMGDLSA
jgi:hypothetical protein